MSETIHLLVEQTKHKWECFRVYALCCGKGPILYENWTTDGDEVTCQDCLDKIVIHGDPWAAKPQGVIHAEK